MTKTKPLFYPPYRALLTLAFFSATLLSFSIPARAASDDANGLPSIDLSLPAAPVKTPTPKPTVTPATPAPAVTAPAPTPTLLDPKFLEPAGTDGAGIMDRLSMQNGVPPFNITAFSRSIDLSQIWWSPRDLALRIGRPAVFTEGALVPWRRSPAGFPAAILKARLSTMEHQEIVIKQAVSMIPRDGMWIVEGSPMVVTLRKGDKEEVLINMADGKGSWRVRLTPLDAFEVGRWTATALNGCRTLLSEKLNNEELRQLLKDSGEVVWRITPSKA